MLADAVRVNSDSDDNSGGDNVTKVELKTAEDIKNFIKGMQ